MSSLIRSLWARRGSPAPVAAPVAPPPVPGAVPAGLVAGEGEAVEPPRETFAFDTPFQSSRIHISSGSIQFVIPANMPIWVKYTKEGVPIFFEQSPEFKKERIELAIKTYFSRVANEIQQGITQLWDYDSESYSIRTFLNIIHDHFNPVSRKRLDHFNLHTQEAPVRQIALMELPYLQVQYKLTGVEGLVDFPVFQARILSDFYHFQQNINPEPFHINSDDGSYRDRGWRRRRLSDPKNNGIPVLNRNNPMSRANELFDRGYHRDGHGRGGGRTAARTRRRKDKGKCRRRACKSRRHGISRR